MNCEEVVCKLSAWSDRELCPEAIQLIDRHIGECPSCRQKALEMTALGRALDDLPPVSAPKGFSRRVRRALHTPLETPDFELWWHHLTLAWRSAVCGAALAGLVCGAVLGTSLPAAQESGSQVSLYQSLYDSTRLYP